MQPCLLEPGLEPGLELGLVLELDLKLKLEPEPSSETNPWQRPAGLAAQRVDVCRHGGCQGEKTLAGRRI